MNTDNDYDNDSDSDNEMFFTTESFPRFLVVSAADDSRPLSTLHPFAVDKPPWVRVLVPGVGTGPLFGSVAKLHPHLFSSFPYFSLPGPFTCILFTQKFSPHKICSFLFLLSFLPYQFFPYFFIKNIKSSFELLPFLIFSLPGPFTCILFTQKFSPHKICTFLVLLSMFLFFTGSFPILF